MKQPATRKRLLTTCLLLLLPAQATAGEQLTLESLVQSADAIVLVDNPLSRPATVTAVLMGNEALQNRPIKSSLCVPSHEIIARWLQTHPQHPARQLWRAVLDDGEMEQVVFLRSIDDLMAPFCETEVMLGLGFSQHAGYAAYRQEIDKLIGERWIQREHATEALDQPPQ